MGEFHKRFMKTDHDLRLVGLGASPYTRKLRAALRFRRLPFRFVVAGSKEAAALPDRPLPLVPYLVVPDENGKLSRALSDTTPILSELDTLYPDRPLRPQDPVLRFLDLLIEDYGDEWLSKCMFHYRWSTSLDTERASAYLPYARLTQMPRRQAEEAAQVFAERQISRIGVVGSNDTTAPVIEASWRRFLKIFEKHIQTSPYFLGSRPGAGDFACYGQMTMLVITDQTPAEIAFKESPRAYAWTEKCEDLSGLDVAESDWVDSDALPETLTALFSEIGRVHVPFLIANAAAIEQGSSSVFCEIDGQLWTQEPFVYQAKCLRWLRQEFDILSTNDKARVAKCLQGTGCGAIFET